MFIHLGEDTVVSDKDIVAIIDLDETTVSKHTRNFLSLSEKQGIVINVSEELPKSAIICERNGKKNVYISQISPVTLYKRYLSGNI